jgi:hypothetical protein
MLHLQRSRQGKGGHLVICDELGVQGHSQIRRASKLLGIGNQVQLGVSNAVVDPVASGQR